MKRLPLIFSCLITLISVSCITASAADLKIGVIDTQKIIMESKKILKFREDFSREFEAKRQALINKQSEAQALENELKTNGASLSYDEMRKKSDELQTKAKEFKRMQEELEAELKAEDAELSRKFLRQIKDVAVEYLQKEKLSLILEKNAVVASDDAIDVTDQIIKLYDSKP